MADGAEELLKFNGETLRELRRSAGLNQEELAHKLGISRSYISQLERGHFHFTDKIIKGLAVVFEEVLKIPDRLDPEISAIREDALHLIMELEGVTRPQLVDEGLMLVIQSRQLDPAFQEKVKEYHERQQKVVGFILQQDTSQT